MFGVSKQTSSTKQIKGSQNAISCHVNSPTPPLPPPNQPQQESMIDLDIRLHYRHFIVCKNVGVYNSHIVISLGKIAARIARYRLACGAGFRFRLTSMTRSISWCSFFPRLSASGTLPLFCCLKKKSAFDWQWLTKPTSCEWLSDWGGLKRQHTHEQKYACTHTCTHAHVQPHPRIPTQSNQDSKLPIWDNGNIVQFLKVNKRSRYKL